MCCQPLRQRLGQIAFDDQLRPHQRVTLSVHGTRGVPLPVADLVHDVMHRRRDVVESLLFVGLDGLH